MGLHAVLWGSVLPYGAPCRPIALRAVQGSVPPYGAQRNAMELHAVLWGSALCRPLPPYGAPCSPMGLSAVLWGSVLPCGAPCRPMGLHTVLWGSAPSYGVPCRAMGLHAALWGSAQSYGSQLRPTALHAALWGSAPSHGALSLWRSAPPHGAPCSPMALRGRRAGSFRDSYSTLSQKTLLLLGWALRFCSAASFVLKADDDTFVHTPALVAHLRGPPAPPPIYYMGRVHDGVRPRRDPRGRHHVPEALYPEPSFPPYCSGSAYALSMGAVRLVLDAAPRTPKVTPEDVFVGLCAHRAGIAPRHVERMGGGARFPDDPCCYGGVLLSAHRVGPDGMRRAWGYVGGWGGWEGGREGRGPCGVMQWLGGVLRCRALALLSGGWG
uniref:Hexosyltransferase n=1 Tax=Gallus gallus TaxID=9031 RepID=A0A8V0X6I2_CHICK